MFMAVSGKKAKGLKIVGEFKSHYVEECDILIVAVMYVLVTILSGVIIHKSTIWLHFNYVIPLT